MNKWFVLGLETSFDDTGTALFDHQLGLMMQLTNSYCSNHQAYGGIVPFVASINHAKQMPRSLNDMITAPILGLRSSLTIACTREPGLRLSLLVGLTYARILSLTWGVNVLWINHTQSHTISAWLGASPPTLPLASLILTGRACSAFYAVNIRTSITLVDAKDNSVGEALDKIARNIMTEPGASGGSCISKLANRPQIISWIPQINNWRAQINCSGIKTLVLSGVKRWLAKNTSLNRADVSNIRTGLAAQTIGLVSELINHNTSHMLSKIKANKLVVAGGVSSSHRITSALIRMGGTRQVFIAPALVRTDNGAMVATLGCLLELSTRGAQHAN